MGDTKISTHQFHGEYSCRILFRTLSYDAVFLLILITNNQKIQKNDLAT